ncbi:unnamed protein product [Mytilus edulis]|uniref:THAP-type domain-containing protein n=1 Tax=Mytilus edulis TaxID=6550 RepID=A0A8S3VCU7_MYTED|nr:unnamed protein product [Mytilus edulis]
MTCQAHGCSTRCSHGISLHTSPDPAEKKELYQTWMINLNLTPISFTHNKFKKVCAEHFEASCGLRNEENFDGHLNLTDCPSGYKYVFQPNLNRAACNGNRYQPFIFKTVGYSDCTYQKSLCNSQGQETYEHGDTRVDRKCICNTDRGYNFVRNSNNQCYCNPSNEDCSCYFGINPYNKTVELRAIKCYDDKQITRSSSLDM